MQDGAFAGPDTACTTLKARTVNQREPINLRRPTCQGLDVGVLVLDKEHPIEGFREAYMQEYGTRCKFNLRIQLLQQILSRIQNLRMTPKRPSTQLTQGELAILKRTDLGETLHHFIR